MSPEKCKLIQIAVKDAGDHLKGKLPPCKFLKERNSYAQLWERIKSKMGKSYKDCLDDEFDTIMNLIDWYKNNPC